VRALDQRHNTAHSNPFLHKLEVVPTMLSQIINDESGGFAFLEPKLGDPMQSPTNPHHLISKGSDSGWDHLLRLWRKVLSSHQALPNVSGLIVDVAVDRGSSTWKSIHRIIGGSGPRTKGQEQKAERPIHSYGDSSAQLLHQPEQLLPT
jgi:hypothetical protein